MDRDSSKGGSRRKRRGTGKIPSSTITVKPMEGATQKSRFGTYERADFEGVEQLIAGFVARRLGQAAQVVMNGFFNAATPEEQRRPGFKTAFYSFLMYGFRDNNGVRVIDHFLHATALEGRQRNALEACLEARFVLLRVGDTHVRKQRIRGRDVLRDEDVTVRDAPLAAQLKPGDHLLAWMIPWGTSHLPIGAPIVCAAHKRDALEGALKSLAQSLTATRLQLPGRHAASLFWVVYRVARM